MAVSIRTIVNSIDSRGFTGSSGPQGPQGFTGSLGYTGSIGNTGAQGQSAGYRYQFSTSILTNEDPLQGFFRFNSTTPASITQISIDLLNVGGSDLTNVIDSWDDANSVVKGYLIIDSNAAEDTTLFVFALNTITVQTGYRQLNVTYLSGATLPAASELCVIRFYRTGDIGYTGSASTVVGYSGSRGFSGSVGPQGFTGSASTALGPTGFTGSIGAGFAGSASTIAGPTGFTGSVGAGFTGSASTAAGLTGFTGSEGAGFTGSQGDFGFVGSQGASSITLLGFQPYKSTIPVAAVIGQGTIQFDAIDIGADVNMDRVVFPIQVVSTNSNPGNVNLTVDVGVYTRNGSTLSSLHATRYLTTVSLSTAASNIYAGQRNLTIPWTTTLAGGEYVFAFRSSTTAATAARITISNMVASMINSTMSGVMFEASNASAQRTLGLGIYSVASASIPGTVAYSQMLGNSSAFQRPQIFFLTSGAVG